MIHNVKEKFFYETCRIMFIKMTFSLGRVKIAQIVEIPFIVFRLERLIFTGQTSH